jgi:uncharacterized membrane protein
MPLLEHLGTIAFIGALVNLVLTFRKPAGANRRIELILGTALVFGSLHWVVTLSAVAEWVCLSAAAMLLLAVFVLRARSDIAARRSP